MPLIDMVLPMLFQARLTSMMSPASSAEGDGVGDEEAVAGGSGGRRRKSAFDVPDIEQPKRERDGGELVN